MSAVLSSNDVHAVFGQFNTAVIPSAVKILILDDSPLDISFLESYLNEMPTLKAKVTVVHTVREAIQCSRNQSFDIAIVDFLLQMETGTEMIKELGGRLAAFPCILTTSLLTPDVMDKAIRSGVMAFLDKEKITSNLMESTIRTTLNNWKLQHFCINQITNRGKHVKRRLSTWVTGRTFSESHTDICDLQQIITDTIQKQDKNKRQQIKLELLDKPVYIRGHPVLLIKELTQLLQAIQSELTITVQDPPFFEVGVMKISFQDITTSKLTEEREHSKLYRVLDNARRFFGSSLAAQRENNHHQIIISFPQVVSSANSKLSNDKQKASLSTMLTAFFSNRKRNTIP